MAHEISPFKGHFVGARRAAKAREKAYAFASPTSQNREGLIEHYISAAHQIPSFPCI